MATTTTATATTTTTTTTVASKKRKPSSYTTHNQHEKPRSVSVATTESSNSDNKRRIRIKVTTDPNTCIESYYFARTFKSKYNSAHSLQVQRIHKQSHPEPVFNIQQIPRRKAAKLSVCADDNLVDDGLYSGSHYDSPTSENEVVQFSKHGVYFLPSSTPILKPNTNMRTTRASTFSGATTAAHASSAALLSSSAPHSSSSAVRQSGICSDQNNSAATATDCEKVWDSFFQQPVRWCLMKDGGGYKVVDKSTNMTIGKWAPKKSSTTAATSANHQISSSVCNTPSAFIKPSEQQWCFVAKYEVHAILENGMLRILKVPEEYSFVDDVARRIRKRYQNKHKQSASKTPPLIQEIDEAIDEDEIRRNSDGTAVSTDSDDTNTMFAKRTSTTAAKFRNSITSLASLKRSHSTNCISTLNSTNYNNNGIVYSPSLSSTAVNPYRARFVDGIVFTSLALLLTLYDEDSKIATIAGEKEKEKEELERPPQPITKEKRKKSLSNIISSIKKHVKL